MACPCAMMDARVRGDEVRILSATGVLGSGFVESSLDEVLALIQSKAEVLDVQKELQTFNDADPLSVGEPPYKHWEPGK